MKNIIALVFTLALFITSYENFFVWFPAQDGRPNKIMSFAGGVYETQDQIEIDYLVSLSEFNNVYTLVE